MSTSVKYSINDSSRILSRFYFVNLTLVQAFVTEKVLYSSISLVVHEEELCIDKPFIDHAVIDHFLFGNGVINTCRILI